ncbi:MAG: DNA polymerase III subunit gamma/tau [Vicinamibacterales bacterium]|nr:DNA polymerase III subunit gamma/tau [Vicinamibacterales bacterium]
MAYTVIARRWRPQSLDEVVGQRHVTQTLRNALGSGRIAQAFVFAGPRGVGKTTTARILARMLNCEQGPTADPCGTCDACREIAEGRDMDVLEIDAATHTQVDNIRDVIISGLAMMPVRDRYKVFIIDEVHQLSNHSFNALLKSIEEPPAHVAFIMATTAPDKIPDTIVSRSQVFEFKTIASHAIAEQLRKIAEADGLTASNEAIALVARSAEGSMRDAETAFDQVIAFAGTTITVEDVATVLGLVGRDLLFDVLTAVADENGPAAFELAGRAVEAGYDLKLLCRELSRLVRDLLVLNVDDGRINDPDIAPEGDRERLTALLPRFSTEDLLRSFDLLTRAEVDIRNAAEPRYHLEMSLLRWIHLRKLTPLSALLEQLKGSHPPAATGRHAAPSFQTRPATAPAGPPKPAASPRPAPASSAAVAKRVSQAVQVPPAQPRPAAVVPDPPPAVVSPPSPPAGQALAADVFLPALMAELQKDRPGTYGTLIAQARGVELKGGRLVISAGAFLARQVTQNKPWVETVAQRVAGRRVPVVVETVEGDAGPGNGPDAGTGPGPAKDDLMAAARANPGVQTLLEIFPAEIKDVAELK